MTQDKRTPPPFKQPLAATRIYWRSPEWKFHTSMGLAKNAIAWGHGSKAREGEIWEYVDGEWILRYECKPGTKIDDLPWRKK